jgi:hypothetical protein
MKISYTPTLQQLTKSVFFFGIFLPGFCNYSSAQVNKLTGVTENNINNDFIPKQNFVAGFNDLLFSEYIEGSSNNKALEIYNPATFPINLANYSIEVYVNGNTTPTNTLSLSGILQPGNVYVIANSSADAAILAVADTTASVCNFNGDDAVVLLNSGTPADIIGEIGFDPGTNWPVSGSAATSEYTLLRDSAVTSPETNWTVASQQWIGYPQNTFIYLGWHGTTTSLYQPGEQDATFTIFPNPSGAAFTLSFPEIKTNGRIEIIDMAGILMFSEDLKQLREITFRHNLPAGIYFVRISANDFVFATRKLLISGIDRSE